MYTRKLVYKLIERMNEPRRFIQIVTGPRQSGKTTAILQALESLSMPRRYTAADDPNILSAEWLRNEWEQARAIAKEQDAIFVIDEIQKVVNWSAAVKQLWDEDTRLRIPLKVILSGSSALMLQKGLAESLMGRFETLYSLHWSYAECKEAFEYSLDEFMYFGGYPGSAQLIKDESRWARYIGSSIVEPTISQDVLSMEEVRKPALFRGAYR